MRRSANRRTAGTSSGLNRRLLAVGAVLTAFGGVIAFTQVSNAATTPAALKGSGAGKVVNGQTILTDTCVDSKLPPHTGFQVAPACVSTEFGEVASEGNDPSLLITQFPPQVKVNTPFTLKVSTRNLIRNRFLAAGKGGYYVESSVLQNGLVRGHFHTACRMLANTTEAPAPDPIPAFFVATEDNKGGATPDTVTLQVPGLPITGIAQCASWAGDGSHRIPMMQRANQTPALDAVRITVLDGGQAGGGNGANGGGNAGNAAGKNNNVGGNGGNNAAGNNGANNGNASKSSNNAGKAGNNSGNVNGKIGNSGRTNSNDRGINIGNSAKSGSVTDNNADSTKSTHEVVEPAQPQQASTTKATPATTATTVTRGAGVIRTVAPTPTRTEPTESVTRAKDSGAKAQDSGANTAALPAKTSDSTSEAKPTSGNDYTYSNDDGVLNSGEKTPAVQQAEPVASTRPLAQTGQNTIALIGGGVLIVLVGLIVMSFARRRRSNHTWR